MWCYGHPTACGVAGVLTYILNELLFTGVYPWKHATIVILNKLNKPNYSQAKAYHLISLLECTRKLLEKIIAKRINHNIEAANLLPMTQFGSCPHHMAINAVATLIHHIQATRATDNMGALLLFNILGFFNNINVTIQTLIFFFTHLSLTHPS